MTGADVPWDDALDPVRPLAPQPERPEGLVALLSEHWPRVDQGLQLRGGGAVAVDTVTLRAAADRFAAARHELEAIGRRLAALETTLRALPERAWDAEASASVLAVRLDAVQSEAHSIAGALREAAYAYEMVEIMAEHRAAALAGESARAERLDARLSALVAGHPAAWRTALGAEFERGVLWQSELVRQATQLGVSVGDVFSEPGAIIGGASAGLLALAGTAFTGIAGTGRLGRDSRLTGAAGPIALRRVAPVVPAAPGGTGVLPAAGRVGHAATSSVRHASGAAAPRSLAAVAERMPGAGDSRVRVERYAMPDGSTQFAVYIAGTQSLALGGDDPWDNASNAELYTGRVSDSYAATEAALEAAGAAPGDVVHAFGHSQGAMIAGHLALEGGYELQTLVSFGSPVEADVGPGTLSVSLRHTDDPVAALAGGGHGQAVGAPGSFVAERVADPDAAPDDLLVPAHRLGSYAETAAMVDASGDPRVDGLHEVFAGLARAESVAVTEFAATRAASPSGGGG